MKLASTKTRFYGQLIKLEILPAFCVSCSKKPTLTEFQLSFERCLKISLQSLNISSRYLDRLPEVWAIDLNILTSYAQLLGLTVRVSKFPPGHTNKGSSGPEHTGWMVSNRLCIT